MRVMLLILATTLACTVPATNPATTEDIRDRDWSLVWVEGFDTLPSGVATPTVRFGTDGRLGGNTGCNSAGANYTVEGERLTVDAIISTKRACLEQAGNRLEVAYIGALENARSYRVTNGQLELLDAGGKVLARFR